MEFIVSRTESACNSLLDFTSLQPDNHSHFLAIGDRFWLLWEYCLGACNPLVWCGSRYQEWQGNRALVRRLYAEGMTEDEIISFALFGSVLGGDEWI